MTDKEFDALVADLEKRYHGKYPALTRKAAVLAVLGYAGLAFFLLAGAALTAATVTWVILSPGFASIKVGVLIGLPSAILTWAVFRGLWVRLGKPEGVRVTRGESPALFALIEGISKEAGGVSFDEVLLTEDMNAAVAQVPRLGVFGWYKTYLLLGVPLMDSTAPEEFKAILAHEFAHLSHQHGRLGSWIYRLRASWMKVMDSLAQHGAPRPVLAFVRWFWPRFNASAFVLSRSQEYQADAFAAKVTSPRSAAMALQRIVVDSRRLGDHFWDEIGREASNNPAPPADVFHRMHAFLGTPADAAVASRWLSGALALKTDTADTHPGLKDRLAALGVPPHEGALPPAPARASDTFLDAALLRSVRDRFSHEWKTGIAPKWTETHRDKLKWQQRLTEAVSGTPAGVWKRIQLRTRIDGLEAVQADVTGYLTEHPEHPMANFFRGSHLAENDDPAALEYLKKASARPDLFHDSLGCMAGLLERLGRSGEIPELERTAHFNSAKIERAGRERAETGPSDRYLPFDMPQAEIEEVIASIRRHPAIKSAVIARKKVNEYPEWPAYIIGIEFERGFPPGEVAPVLQDLVDEVATDAYLLAIVKESSNARIFGTLEKEGMTLPVRSAA